MTLTNKQIDDAIEGIILTDAGLVHWNSLRGDYLEKYMCDYVGTILTALEMAKLDTWQPIETAPTDESRILGFSPHWGDFSYIIEYLKYYNCWCADGDHPMNDDFEEIKPTHWMPLPTPPKKAEE